MPRLTDDELRAYLDEPGRLVRIGTVGADGAPLVVPAWFVHDAEGRRLLVTPRERSAWLANVRREPRVCFTIDGDGAQVVVQGVAAILHEPGDDDAWRDTYRRITLRYLPEAAGEAYLRDTWDEPRALLGLDLSAPTTTVTTWRFPMRPGEDWLDVWAPRYYHEGHPRAKG
jgi:nitroimidazol reductase NimA-like FMN-containing flavoprotein (pyridoxamine 5'-phosphate oxidase superfamily)